MCSERVVSSFYTIGSHGGTHVNHPKEERRTKKKRNIYVIICATDNP